MSQPAMPVYCFSPERRQYLKKRGLIEAQIIEVESILPGCAALVEKDPTLTKMLVQFDELITALGAVQRVFKVETKAACETLNRWQMEAHASGHPLGSDPEFAAKLDLETLSKAARKARRSLGSEQRRSHGADDAAPIRRIADALALGWAKGHEGEFAPPYEMTPATFRDVVQFAYEMLAILGKPECYVPERALKAYRAWCMREAARRATDRKTIGMFASGETFDGARYSRDVARQHKRPAKN